MPPEPELVAAPGDFEGFKWAEPSPVALRAALREVFDGLSAPVDLASGQPSQVVRRARHGWRWVHEHYNHEIVGRIVAEEVAGLAELQLRP